MMWKRFKALFHSQPYIQSSIGMLEGAGQLGAKARPFDHGAAVRHMGSWAYAAAMLNAQAVASVPLRLYVRRKTTGHRLFRTQPVSRLHKRHLMGEGVTGVTPSDSVLEKTCHWNGEFERVTDPHPALEVLRTVNPYQNGFELTVLRMLYLQITGNCYLHPVMDSVLRRPKELWLMPSQWTRIIPGVEQFIDGYTYGANSTTRRRFEPDEVIHWRLPNLSDLYYGQGKLEAVWSAMGLHEAKRTMDLALFDNHARPDYLLVVKQGATAESLDRFEKQIDSKLRGVRNSGKFIAITGDVQATPLNLPPEKIGDEDRVLEEIAAGFGVPISKLLANHPNRASAEVADRAWLRDTIQPYCRLDEEKLNEKYLPLFDLGEDAFLAYDNPVPEDRKLQLMRRTQYVAAGIMTPNEARREEGLDPLPEGDRLKMSAG